MSWNPATAAQRAADNPTALAVMMASLLACALLSCSWPPDVSAADVAWAFTLPDTTAAGEPVPWQYVKEYQVELSTDAGTWVRLAPTDTTYVLPEAWPAMGLDAGDRVGVLVLDGLDPLAYHRVRLRAVNHADEVGLSWSVPSDPLRPIDELEAGPPGLVGAPAVISVRVY